MSNKEHDNEDNDGSFIIYCENCGVEEVDENGETCRFCGGCEEEW